jgi:hypothetical protein
VSYVEKSHGLMLLLVLVIGSILILKPFLTVIILAVGRCVSTWSLLCRAKSLQGDGRRSAALSRPKTPPANGSQNRISQLGRSSSPEAKNGQGFSQLPPRTL